MGLIDKYIVASSFHRSKENNSMILKSNVRTPCFLQMPPFPPFRSRDQRFDLSRLLSSYAEAPAQLSRQHEEEALKNSIGRRAKR